MIDKTTQKTAVIIDGKLTCNVSRMYKDIYSDETPKHIVTLEEKLDAAKDVFAQVRKDNILQTLRDEIANFTAITGLKPTLCLMNYRDVDFVCEAYNDECSDAHFSTSSYFDDRRIIDGVKIKQGCDQKPGDIRFYSAE